MCSKKTTGLSSRIADFRRPFASAGVDGATIFRPGIPISQETGICEWIAPKRAPPPTTERITSGTLCRPSVRNQYLVDWLIRLSMESARKSPNMISSTGRFPDTAAPNAAPVIASSEIGVSKTRLAPYFSYSPGVAAKTPPAAATSSPKKITLSSRASSSSSASRIASRNSISTVPSVMRQRARPAARAWS